MTRRLVPLLSLLLATGCGSAALAPLPAANTRPTAAAADPRSAIQTQLRQLVAERNAQATITPAASAPWQELGRRDGANVRFDLITDLRLSGRDQAERVEFYGDFDLQTGKLVPGTLLVVTDTEATFRMLVPGR